ncbi:MAG: iron-sulfur cluster repair di-iron protein [Bacteroidota bacterium]
MELIKKRIADLVRDNPRFAKALHFLGIRFDNYAEKTLEEVCREKSYSIDMLRRHLEEAGAPEANPEALQLTEYPVDIIVKYLRHAHHLFIKTRLPYIGWLVENLEPSAFRNPQMALDLKFVFPLFRKDYIVHVYEEEDTLFTYIDSLQAATRKIQDPAKLWYLIDKNSIAGFAAEHAHHDDSMEGIRNLTENFSETDTDDLYARVVMTELKSFEQELIVHANIEDRILFPKALLLEQEVIWRLSKHARKN